VGTRKLKEEMNHKLNAFRVLSSFLLGLYPKPIQETLNLGGGGGVLERGIFFEDLFPLDIYHLKILGKTKNTLSPI
jgi:hypothetical protein